MLSIELFREDPKLIKDNIKKKGYTEQLKWVDEIIKLDSEWRKGKQKADNLRAKRNNISKEINEAKKAGKDIKKVLADAKKIPAEIEKIEKTQVKAQEKIISYLLRIPNIMQKDVPKGKDDADNPEVKKWGKIKNFKFDVKNHVELLEKLDLVDFDASGRVSGTGFYYLKKELGLLNQALIRFALDFMGKQGYDYVEPPLMLNGSAIYASMDKDAIEQSVYSVKDEDLNLIGTSEQSLLAMHANQLIPEQELPKKYYSYSMCFRKEIGSHGINEKGLWRTHQFNKIEQFTFCKPDQSEKIYDELLKNTEKLMQLLDLPYRVVEMCTGDLADWKYKSHDIEVYRPTTNAYGEVASLSNCTSYQARKLNIRFIDKKGCKDILHTLNNTAIATSRILVAIVENYQNIDGSITVPKVLVQYMNGLKKIQR
ncbi:serine--tRNA ligase [Nanoarchaeota archaeon]